MTELGMSLPTRQGSETKGEIIPPNHSHTFHIPVNTMRKSHHRKYPWQHDSQFIVCCNNLNHDPDFFPSVIPSTHLFLGSPRVLTSTIQESWVIQPDLPSSILRSWPILLQYFPQSHLVNVKFPVPRSVILCDLTQLFSRAFITQVLLQTSLPLTSCFSPSSPQWLFYPLSSLTLWLLSLYEAVNQWQAWFFASLNVTVWQFYV